MAEGGEASDISISDLPLDEILLKKLEASEELKILIVGCYQVGKSALINALLFEGGEKYVKRAEEGSLRPCTKDVKPFPLKIHGTKVYIYDSPGLQDGSTNDLEYLQMMQKKCPNIHLIIYCKKMGEAIRPAEKAALKSLNTAFGSSIWDNTIIALTQANLVDPSDPGMDEVQHFEKLKQENAKEFQRAFRDFNTNEDVIEYLTKHIYPVGSAKKLKLPGMADGEDWRGHFWKGCIEACSEEAMGAVLRLALHDPAFVAMFKTAASAIPEPGAAKDGGAATPKKSLKQKIADFIKKVLAFFKKEKHE